MKRILRDIRFTIPTIFVSLLTLLLLTYVGYWEASRQYTVFQVSKLATQGEIIKYSVESYLHAGLPLEQYSSFQQLSETLLQSDDGIEYLSILNDSEKQVFFNWRPLPSSEQAQEQKQKIHQNILRKELSQRQYELSETKAQQKHYKVEESKNSFKLSLPLISKFGKTGILVIEASKISMLQVFEKKYDIVFIAYALLILFFSLCAIICEHFFCQSHYKRTILKTLYALSFLVMSGIIVTVVFQIYQHGAQAKTKVLTDSMVYRLNSVLDLGINIDDISGINDLFNQYKNSNPDIQEISLIEDGVCKYHTNKNFVGKKHQSPDDVFEYLIRLIAIDDQKRELFVSVSLPVGLVHKAVLSSANEFITLVIACGLISLIFIDAGTGMSRVLERNNQHISDFRLKLSIIKPAYFLIVFVHAMSISFLPHLITDLAESSGSVWATVSLPFTLYYAMFALMLIPAGQYAEKGSLKSIMMMGCLFEVIGLSLILSTENYSWLLLARMFSGAGQGLFLIGLQSFLLVVTPENQRTQGAAVKVIGRNAGLISGTAIGALLFSFTDYTIVFMIGSSLSIVTMIYLWVLVPKVEKSQPGEQQKPVDSSLNILKNIVIVLKDKDMLKALVLVAMPGKMAITGVIMFATPLLLSTHGFKTGEIGQALMLYYIASILVTYYASRLVDRLDMSRVVLIMSALIGGCSFIILGFSDVNEWHGGLAYLGGEQMTQMAILFNQFLDNTEIPWLATGVIMASLILAGISNALLTSPVITYISKTKTAEQYGIKSVTATYTFLERGGHMLGPILIGSLLTLAVQSNIALSLFGIIIVIFGIIFALVTHKI